MSMMLQLGRKKSVANRSKAYLEEALYVRLFKEGASDLSVRQQLNAFLQSRKRVYKWEVDRTIKELRRRKKYDSALKLSEKMRLRGMTKTVGDQAIHLDLVAKSRGITAAENYFVDLPEESKNHFSYSALLNCYCKELWTEKAEALMQKMKELGLNLTSIPYNSIMTLYTKIGQPEKITAIIQEMKADDIMLDTFTYNIWMRALAAVNDISGVERVIEEMKRDGRVSGDWTTYSNIASIYVDAGLSEKAEEALKELEKRNVDSDFFAFQFLITLYGRTGNLLQVYRVWRSLRLACRKTGNVSYLNMIQALVKLKDIPGAEKCFEEWESTRTTNDIRIANALIEAYVREGLLEKAKYLKERSRKSGANANAKTWEIFLDYYLKNGEMKLATECVANAISCGRGGGRKWVPSPETVGTLMQHFEKVKDVDGAEQFVELLSKAVDVVGPDVFESLIRTYVAAGKTSPIMRRRMKMENVLLSEEGKKLLDVICVD